MRPERKYTITSVDASGTLYELTGAPAEFDQIFTREELCFLGLPQIVLNESRKAPITFTITFELV